MQKQTTAERNGWLSITIYEAESILEALRNSTNKTIRVGLIVNEDNWDYRTQTKTHFAQISVPTDANEFVRDGLFCQVKREE